MTHQMKGSGFREEKKTTENVKKNAKDWIFKIPNITYFIKKKKKIVDKLRFHTKK